MTPQVPGGPSIGALVSQHSDSPPCHTPLDRTNHLAELWRRQAPPPLVHTKQHAVAAVDGLAQRLGVQRLARLYCLLVRAPGEWRRRRRQPADAARRDMGGLSRRVWCCSWRRGEGGAVGRCVLGCCGWAVGVKNKLNVFCLECGWERLGGQPCVALHGLSCIAPRGLSARFRALACISCTDGFGSFTCCLWSAGLRAALTTACSAVRTCCSCPGDPVRQVAKQAVCQRTRSASL